MRLSLPFSFTIPSIPAPSSFSPFHSFSFFLFFFYTPSLFSPSLIYSSFSFSTSHLLFPHFSTFLFLHQSPTSLPRYSSFPLSSHSPPSPFTLFPYSLLPTSIPPTLLSPWSFISLTLFPSLPLHQFIPFPSQPLTPSLPTSLIFSSFIGTLLPITLFFLSSLTLLPHLSPYSLHLSLHAFPLHSALPLSLSSPWGNRRLVLFLASTGVVWSPLRGNSPCET